MQRFTRPNPFSQVWGIANGPKFNTVVVCTFVTPSLTLWPGDPIYMSMFLGWCWLIYLACFWDNSDLSVDNCTTVLMQCLSFHPNPFDLRYLKSCFTAKCQPFCWDQNVLILLSTKSVRNFWRSHPKLFIYINYIYMLNIILGIGRLCMYICKRWLWYSYTSTPVCQKYAKPHAYVSLLDGMVIFCSVQLPDDPICQQLLVALGCLLFELSLMNRLNICH